MEQASNINLNSYKSRAETLGSLVINLPFEKDTLSSPKTLDLDIPYVLTLIQKGIVGMFTFLLASCIIFCCIFTPLQNQNINLHNTKKILMNKQLSLLVKEQEASSYKRLFDAVAPLALTEPKEIINMRKNSPSNDKKNKSKDINKYPLIQYTGF